VYSGTRKLCAVKIKKKEKDKEERGVLSNFSRSFCNESGKPRVKILK
jgi:hypothetical protein